MALASGNRSIPAGPKCKAARLENEMPIAKLGFDALTIPLRDQLLAESLALGVVAIAILSTGAAAAAGFTQSATPRVLDTAPAVTETNWISVRGPSAFDRIGLHRLAAGFKPPGPVVIYLPGTNMNGELPLANPDHWLPLYLAIDGVNVWTLDYRTHFIPPDTPQSGLSELAGWTDDLFGYRHRCGGGLTRPRVPPGFNGCLSPVSAAVRHSLTCMRRRIRTRYADW